MNMNSIKRQNSFNNLTNNEIKKLRTLSNEKTCFEHLCNEILYEIFDYMDPYDVNAIFSKFNIRFYKLIVYSTLPLKMNIAWKSAATIENYCRAIIIPNKHRILSLGLNQSTVIENILSHCNIDASFHCLESVKLKGVTDHQLMMALFYLKNLPRLFSLTIQLEDYSGSRSDIYRMIFYLEHLKFLSMSISDDYDDEDYDIFIPISINPKFSTIEHLVLNHQTSINELISIISHTPQLRYLNCEQLVEKVDDTIRYNLLLNLSKLTNVTFRRCNVEFNLLKELMKAISSQIQVWHITTSQHRSYIDANQWKQLIQRHMPNLREFYFHHTSYNYDDDIPVNCETVNQFMSPFWLKRQWFFELEDQFNSMSYSIRPYRKKWYDYHKHEYNRICSDKNMSQQESKCLDINHQRISISRFEFTIDSYPSAVWDISYIDYMKPLLFEAQFTHLNIQCKNTPVDLLIDIVHVLSKLQSLEISSLPLVNINNLSIETSAMLLLVSISHEISTVKLDKMINPDQIYFLMDLCPRMRYLEIGYSTCIDLENILGYISRNNSTHVPRLCCLCICSSDDHENILQCLQSTIGFTRLFNSTATFRDYSIKRTHNKIFLQWNQY